MIIILFTLEGVWGAWQQTGLSKCFGYCNEKGTQVLAFNRKCKMIVKKKLKGPDDTPYKDYLKCKGDDETYETRWCTANCKGSTIFIFILILLLLL